MIIEVKYNVGDEVIWKSGQNTLEQQTCPFCNGTKIVEGHDKSIAPCPKCNGKGTVPVVDYIEGSGIIKSFTVDYNSEFPGTGPNIRYNISTGGYLSESAILGKKS